MFTCTRPISGVSVSISSPKCSEKGAVSLTVCTWQCWASIPFLGKIQWISLRCLWWFQLIWQSLHLNRAETQPQPNLKWDLWLKLTGVKICSLCCLCSVSSRNRIFTYFIFIHMANVCPHSQEIFLTVVALWT